MKNSEFKIGSRVVNIKTGEKGEVVITTQCLVHVLIDFGSGRGRDYLPDESDLLLMPCEEKS